MPISKTDFVRALQCQKMLWLDAHMPAERIIPPEVQAKLDAGNAFGDNAMGIFGPFVETTTFRDDGRLHYAEMIRKTQTLLQNGENVICEAAFSWYGNYCAVDILKKQESGWIIYEVKNAPSVRKEFISDLGFQSLILRKSGVNVLACKLVLRDDKEQEEEKLDGQVCVERITHAETCYKIVDVSALTKRMERVAEKRIFELGKIKTKEAPCPAIAMGEQCNSPYPCWYYEFCKKSE